MVYVIDDVCLRLRVIANYNDESQWANNHTTLYPCLSFAVVLSYHIEVLSEKVSKVDDGRGSMMTAEAVTKP